MKTKYYGESARTVFKYKGKLPAAATTSLYAGNKKYGYEKYLYKKGRLASVTAYSSFENDLAKHSYKNGDRVKSVFYTYTNGRKKLDSTAKYTYKKHKLVKWSAAYAIMPLRAAATADMISWL